MLWLLLWDKSGSVHYRHQWSRLGQVVRSWWNKVMNAPNKHILHPTENQRLQKQNLISCEVVNHRLQGANGVFGHLSD